MDERNNDFDFDFTPIGLAIKKARTTQGMTREQLARIVDYDPRHLQAIENEGQKPSLELFIQLVTMFNISVDEYIFPNKEVNKSSARRRLDAQLDNLDDKELSIVEATVNGLCKEYNKMLLDKTTGANSIVQDKYVTVSVCKKNIEEARNYFARVGADLIAHFSRLGSKCVELDAGDKLRIFHDFYRTGEETAFHFDIIQTMRKGHDFKDFICPDTFEFESDCFRMGNRYGRVIFLREYAAYIKDSMVAELCELNRNMMLSVDIIPVPTDEAVREVENRLLGVETNITNWQRKQNQNNNFSAVIPYDLEQQRKESKEFLDDLTTRDQRMMFAVLTMVHTAESKEQLDNDTEALLTTARKHLCQFAVLKYQQMDGLNTALPFGVRKIDALRTLTTESLALISLTSKPDSSMFDGSRSTPSLWWIIPCEASSVLSSMMFCITVESVMGISSGLLYPRAIVRFACASASISRTFLPCCTRLTPRLTAVVVFPTPPFWLVRAITLQFDIDASSFHIDLATLSR